MDEGPAATTAAASRTQAQSQRQAEMLRRVRAAGRVEVSSLAAAFDVTTETIRRDLSELQQRRLVRRVHGGAVPWRLGTFEPRVAERDAHHAEEKRRIATAAVAELPPEGSVILDSGSTTGRFAGYFPTDRELVAITNSLVIARILADRDEVDVIVLGGKLRRKTLALVDSITVAALSGLRADVVFLSCDGLTVSHGLTTPYQAEAALKDAMIRAARRVVALVDSSKFGSEHLFLFTSLDRIDTVITDDGVDPADVAAIESAGVSVTVA